MSLSAIVRAYVSQIRPLAANELDWFQKQPDLKTAIELAALAINRKSKRYKHQRRLKQETLNQAKRILVSNTESISRCPDFDQLFELIDSLLKPVNGIGELYVYDTSLRIGAKLNLLPTKVYLHAGTRVGAKALGFDGKVKSLDTSALPTELHGLAPHEIEDVLCIFKDKLKRIKYELSDKEIRLRSWCG